MWEERLGAELDRYVDTLLADGQWAAALPPGLEELAALARRVRWLLTPVEPSPHFREALHARLLVAAKESMLAPAVPWHTQHRREIIIGAAVGSVLSVAGLAAVIARLRWTTKSAA